MARTWASGDHVDMTIGTLVGITAGANTIAIIARRGADSVWQCPVAVQPSAGNPALSVEISNVNKLSYVSSATDVDTGVSFTVADGWCLLAVDKSGGTGIPNGHKYVYATNTWTHSAAGTSVGGSSADLTGGKVQLGRWAAADPWVGDLAVVGVWKRQLTPDEIENLAYSLQAWYVAAPDMLLLLDQATTAQQVIDLAGQATQQAIAGTAVSTSSVPVFTYGSGPQVAVGHAGGGAGQTVAVGAAVDTGTAVTLNRVKRRAAGQAVEPDTAVAVGRAKRRTVGIAAETDAAATLIRSKRRTVGQATETGTATPAGRVKVRAPGLAAEAATTVPVGRAKARAVGTASDTETARPASRAKRRTVGIAAETDTALAAGGGNSRTISPAAESDTTVAAGRRKARQVGTAGGTDSAQTAPRAKARTVGAAAETDSARPVGWAKARGVAAAGDTSTALPIGNPASRAIGTAGGLDTARPVAAAKRRFIAVVGDTSSAGTPGRGKRRHITVALELDVAVALLSPAIPGPAPARYVRMHAGRAYAKPGATRTYTRAGATRPHTQTGTGREAL
ncbi:hypothetical protein Drose_06180 [Dactylosporangium roseum]|uniref:Minor tail protein n=1 Tax=Dactylosporangium roseum TaxID=47989 RepID=A0ABY5ZA44_9ACTN|nr:hypothetical protein [Dactylosporangium roseum]UWZ37860.1 hypothetical protein Drose_06180 [Dactylosporangium roseum]